MTVAQGKDPPAGGAPAVEKKEAVPPAASPTQAARKRFRLRGRAAAPGDGVQGTMSAAEPTRVATVPMNGDVDDREGNGNGRQHHLRARISKLEAELTELRESPPDLSRFGETELAAMASEAAATILRTAMRAVEQAGEKARALAEAAAAEVKTMRASAGRDADVLRHAAAQDSTRLREAAATDAEAVRKDAEAQAAAKVKEAEHIRTAAVKEAARSNDEAAAAAETVRKEAEAQAAARIAEANAAAEVAEKEAAAKVKEAENLRRTAARETTRLREEAAAAAEAVRKEAEAQSAAKLAKAHEEAETLVQQAAERRDALLADLEVRRRFIVSMLEDANELEGAFAEAYQHFRKALDETASHLSAPIERAKRQRAHIDRELKKTEE